MANTDHDVSDQERQEKFSTDARRRTLAVMLQSTNTLRAATENFIVVCLIVYSDLKDFTRIFYVSLICCDLAVFR